MIFSLLAVGFVIFLGYELWYKRLQYPQGPVPIPLLGNASSFWDMERWEDKFLEWKRKFGPIYTYWLGTEPVIAINDYELMKKMFVNDGDTYSDRFTTTPLDSKTRGGPRGIIESQGAEWREQRQYALKVMSEFSNKNKVQDWALNEIQTLIQNVNQDISAGKIEEHNFQQHTDIAVASVINTYICGYSFTSNSNYHQYHHLSSVVNELTTQLANPLANLGAINSIFCHIPPFKGPFEKLAKAFTEIGDFLNHQIEKRSNGNLLSGEEKATNFIDAYLIEMERQNKENGRNHHFSKNQLKNVALDMWLAGKETISYTITYTIAYLIKNPKCQKQLHDELDKIIGGNRPITMSDKPNLHYTNAVIMESQRMASIVTQNLIRRTTRNVKIEGYSIKKGTAIVAQISAVMADPSVFQNPQQFDPSRFLDPTTNELKPRDEWMAFSIGRRLCLGEQIAKIELFLFISNLFNQYEFLPGNVPPSLLKLSAAVPKAPMPYKCRIKQRY